MLIPQNDYKRLSNPHQQKLKKIDCLTVLIKGDKKNLIVKPRKWRTKWKLEFKISFYWTKLHWKNLWKIYISGKIKKHSYQIGEQMNTHTRLFLFESLKKNKTGLKICDTIYQMHFYIKAREKKIDLRCVKPRCERNEKVGVSQKVLKLFLYYIV